MFVSDDKKISCFLNKTKKVVICWLPQQYDTEETVIFLAYFIPV